MTERVQTVLLVLVLLGAGALLGSFVLEWRGTVLKVPGESRELVGLPSAVPGEPGQERISVEVLNGAGEPGAAARVTEALRDAGYDVKTFGNASSFDFEATIVVDRSGRAAAARSVADALGVAEVLSEPVPALYVDATVILGRDWRRRLTDLR